jgi:hypothetical protein
VYVCSILLIKKFLKLTISDKSRTTRPLGVLALMGLRIDPVRAVARPAVLAGSGQSALDS